MNSHHDGCVCCIDEIKRRCTMCVSSKMALMHFSYLTCHINLRVDLEMIMVVHKMKPCNPFVFPLFCVFSFIWHMSFFMFYKCVYKRPLRMGVISSEVIIAWNIGLDRVKIRKVYFDILWDLMYVSVYNFRCHPWTGACICKPGYAGSHCHRPCPTYTWGKDCRNVCDCQNYAFCNGTDGTCTCSPGYLGEK